MLSPDDPNTRLVSGSTIMPTNQITYPPNNNIPEVPNNSSSGNIPQIPAPGTTQPTLGTFLSKKDIFKRNEPQSKIHFCTGESETQTSTGESGTQTPTQLPPPQLDSYTQTDHQQVADSSTQTPHQQLVNTSTQTGIHTPTQTKNEPQPSILPKPEAQSITQPETRPNQPPRDEKVDLPTHYPFNTPTTTPDTRPAGGGKSIKEKKKNKTTPPYHRTGKKFQTSDWPDWFTPEVKKPPNDYIPKPKVVPEVKKTNDSKPEVKKQPKEWPASWQKNKPKKVKLNKPALKLIKSGLKVKPSHKLLNRDGMRLINNESTPPQPPPPNPSGLPPQSIVRQPMRTPVPNTRKRKNTKDINVDFSSKKSLNTDGSITNKNSKGSTKPRHVFKDWYPDY